MRAFTSRASERAKFEMPSASARVVVSNIPPGSRATAASCAFARVSTADVPPRVNSVYLSAIASPVSKIESRANEADCGSTNAYVPKVIMSAIVSAVNLCANSTTGETAYAAC